MRVASQELRKSHQLGSVTLSLSCQRFPSFSPSVFAITGLTPKFLIIQSFLHEKSVWAALPPFCTAAELTGAQLCASLPQCQWWSIFTISDHINKHIDSGERSTLQPTNLPAPAWATKYQLNQPRQMPKSNNTCTPNNNYNKEIIPWPVFSQHRWDSSRMPF